MKITEIKINNFRILENTSISLDKSVTLVVGRNNSGKTSLTEFFNKFFGSENALFRFEDFSLNTYSKFKESLNYYQDYVKAVKENKPDDEILSKEELYKITIPKITADIYIEYEESDDLSNLSKFIMDLNPERKDTFILCEYSITFPEKFFKSFLEYQKEYDGDIIEFMRKHFNSFFYPKIYAVDKENTINIKEINKRELEHVFLARFIYAQNLLDDQSMDKSKGLSKGFEEYYKFNSQNNDDVKSIEKALIKISAELDGKYETLFKNIFRDLKNFGINTGVNLQELKIKSKFEAESILKGNTNLFYNHDEYLLPEFSNGLGYSKLIYITLRFIGFCEEYMKREPRPDFHLIFIEEPEAHLHPQMQCVFIKNIREFIKSKVGWNVQVILTTHSSHIISESGFVGVRYFDNTENPIKVRNLSKFKEDLDEKKNKNIDFLIQYMTINKCDMFFADKLILVEGTVEKVLLPEMIKKESPGLLNQYISIIEVGGAYAHKFKELIEFINVKTLIITDIDSVDPNDSRKKCAVSLNSKSSNQTLVQWIPKNSGIKELLNFKDEDKINGKVRVTYQIQEEGISQCGRSFEEAFILKNAKYFAENKKDISCKSIFENKEGNKKTKDEIIAESYQIADEIPKKSDFAFDIIQLTNWETPKYIKEGLQWLEK